MPKLPGGSLTAAQLEQLAKQLLGNMRPNRILLPGTDGARSAASTRLLQQRVELLRRKATSFETARPAYTVPAAWQAGPESGEAAEGPQRTPFASQLLGSVQNGLPPLPWSLLQSWDGYELPALPAGGPGDHLEAEESQAAPGRRQLGRYFQGGSASQAAGLPAGAAAPAAAPTAASSSPAAGPAALSEADWRQCFESLQGQEGEWLLLAVKCLGFRQPEPDKSGGRELNAPVPYAPSPSGQGGAPNMSAHAVYEEGQQSCYGDQVARPSCQVTTCLQCEFWGRHCWILCLQAWRCNVRSRCWRRGLACR